MALFSKPLRAPGREFIFITTGVWMIAWCLMWFSFHTSTVPGDMAAYGFSGILAVGLVLTLIGLGIGRNRRMARSAHQQAPARNEETFDELPAFVAENLTVTASLRTSSEQSGILPRFLPAKTA